MLLVNAIVLAVLRMCAALLAHEAKLNKNMNILFKKSQRFGLTNEANLSELECWWSGAGWGVGSPYFPHPGLRNGSKEGGDCAQSSLG